MCKIQNQEMNDEPNGEISLYLCILPTYSNICLQLSGI